jgi:hypothetical protein
MGKNNTINRTPNSRRPRPAVFLSMAGALMEGLWDYSRYSCLWKQSLPLYNCLLRLPELIPWDKEQAGKRDQRFSTIVRVGFH